jgi:YegS/Rv2252/BmrU family lipid kinase
MSRLLVIVNPAARGGRAADAASRHVDVLRARFEDVRVEHTSGPGHATRIAGEAAAQRIDALVCAGGDGTLFEVVNGLLDSSEPPPPLGILAVGTGNSFVRDLDQRDPDAAVRAILAGGTRAIDAVRVEHSEGVLHYVNLLSLGFSARAGDLTNRRFKPLGAAGYVLAVLQCLVRLRSDHYPYRCDGGQLDAGEVALLSFCNSRYTGGDMMMAPDADPSDGQLDVVRIGAMGRRRFLSSFPRIFRGTHPEMSEVDTRRARSVEFEIGRPVLAMVDGEILELDLRRLDVVVGALRVFG